MKRNDTFLVLIILLFTFILAFFIGSALRKQVIEINNAAYSNTELPE